MLRCYIGSISGWELRINPNYRLPRTKYQTIISARWDIPCITWVPIIYFHLLNIKVNDDISDFQNTVRECQISSKETVTQGAGVWNAYTSHPGRCYTKEYVKIYIK